MEVTDEAVGILRRSLAMTGGVGAVRLRGARGLGGGFAVQIELADEPLPEEEIVETRGIRIFVDPAVVRALPDAVVTVSPQHETIVVRPAHPSDG